MAAVVQRHLEAVYPDLPYDRAILAGRGLYLNDAASFTCARDNLDWSARTSLLRVLQHSAEDCLRVNTAAAPPAPPPRR